MEVCVISDRKWRQTDAFSVLPFKLLGLHKKAPTFPAGFCLSGKTDGVKSGLCQENQVWAYAKHENKRHKLFLFLFFF